MEWLESRTLADKSLFFDEVSKNSLMKSNRIIDEIKKDLDMSNPKSIEQLNKFNMIWDGWVHMYEYMQSKDKL